MDLENTLLRAGILLSGFLFSGWAACWLTLRVRNHAITHGWVDPPNHRSSHQQPIPRIGGVAIIAAFFIGILAFQLLQVSVPMVRDLVDQPPLLFLVAALFIGLLGLYDDFKGLGAWRKLAGQSLAALLVITAGYRFNLSLFPGMEGTPAGEVFSFLLTFAWIVGLMNAVNLIDGLDGLAAGISAIAVSALTIVTALRGAGADLVFVAVFLGSLFGFLRHNFHPATIFMGDSGSLFLGFLLATFALQATPTAAPLLSFLPVLLILGIPITDTLLSILRRAASGNGLMTADRDHIHHRLRERLGLSHRNAVLTLYGVSCCLAAFAVLLTIPLPLNLSLMSLLCCAGMMIYFVARLGYLSFLEKQQRGRWLSTLTHSPFGKSLRHSR